MKKYFLCRVSPDHWSIKFPSQKAVDAVYKISMCDGVHIDQQNFSSEEDFNKVDFNNEESPEQYETGWFEFPIDLDPNSEKSSATSANESRSISPVDHQLETGWFELPTSVDTDSEIEEDLLSNESSSNMNLTPWIDTEDEHDEVEAACGTKCIEYMKIESGTETMKEASEA